MPQLDFVGFYYILNILSFIYVFIYIVFTLFLLKPIFKEFFYLYAFPTLMFLEVMLFFSLYSNRVVFTALLVHTPCLGALKAKVKKRWDWYKYIPKLRARVLRTS